MKVWKGRFIELRKAGLNDYQLECVFKMLSEAKAFRYRWIEMSAMKQLAEVMEGK